MNLEELDLPTLLKIAEDLPGVIAKKKAAERNVAKAEMEVVARKYGLTLQDVFGSQTAGDHKPSRRSRSTLPVKFQHPSDQTLTWTGRGRKPQWVLDWEGSGQDMASLLVK